MDYYCGEFYSGISKLLEIKTDDQDPEFSTTGENKYDAGIIISLDPDVKRTFMTAYIPNGEAIEYEKEDINRIYISLILTLR